MFGFICVFPTTLWFPNCTSILSRSPYKCLFALFSILDGFFRLWVCLSTSLGLTNIILCLASTNVFYSSFLWWSNPLHVLTQEKKNYYKPTMIQPQRVCQNFSKDSTISFRNFSDAPHILTLIHTFTTDVLFINENCSIIFLRQHSQSQNSIWRIKLKAAL